MLSAADQERIASILAGEPENDKLDGEMGADDDEVAQPDDEGDDDEEEFEEADDDDAEIAAEAGVNGTYVGVLCSGLMWSQSQVCTIPVYDFLPSLAALEELSLLSGYHPVTSLQLLLTRGGMTVLESGEVEAALVRAHAHTSRLFHLHCLP